MGICARRVPHCGYSIRCNRVSRLHSAVHFSVWPRMPCKTPLPGASTERQRTCYLAWRIVAAISVASWRQEINIDRSFTHPTGRPVTFVQPSAQCPAQRQRQLKLHRQRREARLRGLVQSPQGDFALLLQRIHSPAPSTILISSSVSPYSSYTSLSICSSVTLISRPRRVRAVSLVTDRFCGCNSMPSAMRSNNGISLS